MRLGLPLDASHRRQFNLCFRPSTYPLDEPTEDDFQKLEELDSLVHNAIGEAAGNSRMSLLIRELDEMMLVMRVGDMRTRHHETHQSLRQILVALLNRVEMQQSH